MNILHAPELRIVGERPLYRTQTGIVIGSAYLRPAPRPSADGERIQRALLPKPRVRHVIPNRPSFWRRVLRLIFNR